MKKKIYLAGLAAGILLAMLPAGTVKASEKQTTEEYYYQLLLSGAYPYNTAANAGGLNAAAGLPAGSWEQIVALANQQLTQAVARQQALQAERQNMEAQLQAAGQAVAQAQAALTARPAGVCRGPAGCALQPAGSDLKPTGGSAEPAGSPDEPTDGKPADAFQSAVSISSGWHAPDSRSCPDNGAYCKGAESSDALWLQLRSHRHIRCADPGGADSVPDQIRPGGGWHYQCSGAPAFRPGDVKR